MPPLDPADAADSSDNSRSNYSGPTVVDDAKVEQGLKKLRSLDARLRPLDRYPPGDRRRARRPGPRHAGHARAGQSLDAGDYGSIPGAEPPSDAASAARSWASRPPSRSTTARCAERCSATAFTCPISRRRGARCWSRPRRRSPSSSAAFRPPTEITVFQPGTYPQQAELPRAQEPYPRSSRSHAQDTPIELRTVLPRNTLIIRVAATGAGIAAIVVAALLWVRSTDEADLNARSPVGDPRGTAAETGRGPADGRTPTPSPPPPPPPAPQPAAVAPRQHRRRPTSAAAETPADRDRRAAAEPTPHRSHGSSTHSERHHSSASSEPRRRGRQAGRGRKTGAARQAEPDQAAGRGRSRRHDGAFDRVIGAWISRPAAGALRVDERAHELAHPIAAAKLACYP